MADAYTAFIPDRRGRGLSGPPGAGYSQAKAIEDVSAVMDAPGSQLVLGHSGGGSTSTVGTITDIYSVLRLLFSRAGKPYAGSAIAFSFNDARGMCPECSGIGRKIGVDLDAFLDTSKSLNDGAILFPE